jgi:hypothetical protein
VVARLTRNIEAIGFETSPVADEIECMQRARDDIDVAQLRDHMLHAIQAEGAVELLQ